MKKTPVICLLVTAALLVSACTGGNNETDTAGTAKAVETVTQGAETDDAINSESVAESATDSVEAATDGEDGMEAEADFIRAGGTVRVVSYNLDANLSTVKARSVGMIAILQNLDPDSFGVQECRPAWLSALKRGMKGYSYIGLSADGETPSETTFGTYIFYKTDKYAVIDSGTFWLSKTPDVPSKYGSTVDCNRTCCWVILEDKETGFRYVHMNSHLDWMDAAATGYQIELIRSQIEVFDAMGLPVFATGDYNTDEGSSVYHRMLKSAIVADAKYEAAVSMDIGTYPDYDTYDVSETKPIDFCFVTKNKMTVSEYRVVNDKYNGAYVSDHFGLCIDATVPDLPDLYATSSAPVMNGEVTVSDITSGRFVLSFSAATTKEAPVTGYCVTVSDTEGNTVYEDTVSSDRLSPNPPDSFTASVSGLTPSTEYTVCVTARDLFGNVSEALTVTARTAKPTAMEDVGGADIFDLCLNNTWTDISDAGLDIQKVGNVRIETVEGQTALVTNGGNLKIPGIRNYYKTLGQGFTMELDIKVGMTSGFSSLMSNMHAGGFGFDIEDGTLEFALYCKKQYTGVTVSVTTDDRLHLVATYDGSVLTLYVNGELQDSKTVGKVSSFATDDGAKYLCIGADSDATGVGEYPSDAVIFAARIWSEPLTAGQVGYLYAAARQ